MPNRPYWWPKNEKELQAVLQRAEAFRSDYRLWLIQELVVFSFLLAHGFLVAIIFLLFLLLTGRTLENTRPLVVLAISLVGLLFAKIIGQLSPDMFRFRAELLLRFPLSSKSRHDFSKDFGIKL